MNTSLEQDLALGRTARVAVVVAHPDDETLWAGGLLLSHPDWSVFILTLCRGEDPDRAPKFFKVLERLGAKGAMGKLDDGPDQFPLSSEHVEDAILSLLPRTDFDILLTHAPQGEYTWHRRHGEVSRAVQELWRDGRIQARALWQFAYEDGGGTHAPRPQEEASLRLALSDAAWQQKYGILTTLYGFDEGSWEARAASRIEAFRCFTEPDSMPPVAEDGQTLAP
jgi:LmbE family N-acetylglucosaminyl deacetylase